MSLITDRTKRTEWFLHDRFGMFIHWGLYAIPARGEWIRNGERISNEDYQKYFEEFNPDRYDPKQWARLAREAGMKYVVLTTKHHDGFCLFDSKLTDYTAMNTKAKRDLVREYVDALRAEGLKVGFYYSLLDWHHEGYPAFADLHHPMRENPEYKGKTRDFSTYVDYFHGQVRELLTNYGKIDIIWFDFSYGEMSGEKWQATKLVKMVRELQPGIIIDNRLEASGDGFGSIVTSNPSVYSGDFASPEQVIPNDGIVDADGKSVPWEACITMNNNWGYHAGDSCWKTSRQLIRKIVECTSKNGNLILNVGPTARGEIPENSVRILKEIGAWMAKNGASIYGCGAPNLPKPDWGWYTRKGNLLYAHVLDGPIGPLCFPKLNGKVKKARLVADGSEMPLMTPWNVKAFPEHAFVNFGAADHMTHPLPDETDSVIELELK
jgi:alpha-L-fucosidase